jgi:hypothetical protein
MSLLDFVNDLPEDKRKAFSDEAAKYADLSTIDRNPEFQRQLSLKHETTMANFMRDKLPGMIDEEVKKRGTKQPWEIEIENLKRENAEKDRLMVLKERKSQALAELAKHGIDPDLADFVITDDEAKFKANIDRLVGKMTSFRDDAIKTEKEKIYSTNPPRGGSQTGKKMSEEAFSRLTPKERAAFMADGGSLE